MLFFFIFFFIVILFKGGVHKISSRVIEIYLDERSRTCGRYLTLSNEEKKGQRGQRGNQNYQNERQRLFWSPLSCLFFALFDSVLGISHRSET